jgi:hypothetical protein
MNNGYLVVVLGVLGAVLGAGMYATDWHRTIGLGGVALGIVLVIAGFWLSRSGSKMAKTTMSQPQM